MNKNPNTPREIAAAIVVFAVSAIFTIIYNVAFFVGFSEGLTSPDEPTSAYTDAAEQVVETEQVVAQESKSQQEYIKSWTTSKAEENQNTTTQKPKQQKQQATQSSVPGKYPEVSTRRLTDSDLRHRSKRELKIMRNEVFARHGYIFKTADMKNYFNQQSWYKGRYSNVNSKLTDLEYKNVKMIQEYEIRK